MITSRKKLQLQALERARLDLRVNTLTRLAQIFIFCALLTIHGCSNQSSSNAGLVIRRGLSGEPSSLDPAAAADNFSHEVLDDLYEGLTVESPSGDVLPGAASSWTVSPAGTEYTFTLRPGARWSNGRALRAQDFVSAWQRVVDPKRGSPVADDLRLIVGAASIIEGKKPPSELGAVAIDDVTIAVQLEQPAPYFPQLLTHAAAYPIFSAATVGTHDPKTWVSNGPYVLAAWYPGSKLILSQNHNYWDSRKVHVPSVEYDIAEENSQYSRFRAGQIDITDSVPASALGEIRSQRSKELEIAPFLATAYYGLNLAKPPFSNNKSLRQAMAMAIDRRRLVSALGFGQAAAYGFVAPGIWNYSPQFWKWERLEDGQRAAEAQRLYAEAGYSTSNPLHVKLLFNSDPTIRKTAIIVSAMWRDTLGVETLLVDEEYRVFLQSRHDQTKWEVARLGWIADFNDASNFLDIFRSYSGNNDLGYSNPQFDELLSSASKTQDVQERRAILEQSERLMLEDYPVLPLYFYVSRRLIKTYVHGVALNPMNRLLSKWLELTPH